MFKRKKSEEEVKAKKKKKRRARRLFFLVVAGGGAALASSKDLRSKVLDRLFGAEKEFTYTPPAADADDKPEA